MPDRSFSRKARPTFMMAATGEREKAKVRRHSPDMGRQFSTAHEGPREPIAKPTLHTVHTPTGPVVAAVHTEHDREAIRRNRARDNQMKQWRSAIITKARTFNTRSMAPERLRAKRKPEILKQRTQQVRGQQARGR